MSSKAGTLTAALLSAPLGALAMMAVVGMPQFAPGKGAAQEDEAALDQPMFVSDPRGDRREGLFDSVDEASDAPQWDQSPNSLFGNRSPREDERSEPSGSRRERSPADDQAPQDTNRLPRDWADAEQTPRMRTAVDNRAGGQEGRSEPPQPSLGWKDAQRRLSDLGIQDYHLERGSQEGSFLFVCMFSPGDDQRIVQRFEAEADDPLLAVEDVLRQVNQWLQRRFADGGRTSGSPRR